MELIDIILLYKEEQPTQYEVIDSSHGEADFRQSVLSEWNGEKIVIKITCNDFTTPERIQCWGDTVEQYIEAGYYAPRFLKNRSGNYAEKVTYHDHECVVYAEEFSIYKTAEQYGKEHYMKDGRYIYHNAALKSIGVIGSKHLTTAHFPSGYCIMEKFCPSDPCDEVLEVSLDFKEKFEQSFPQLIGKMNSFWSRFMENRARLETIYPQLPTSVFQADLNYSNILLNENLEFVGVLDFNLCGYDTILNYLFREISADFSEEIHIVEKNGSYQEVQAAEKQVFVDSIQMIKEVYPFCEIEMEAAILIYRYLKPIWWWWSTTENLINIKGDEVKGEKILNRIEYELTRTDIDFKEIMG